MSSNTPSTSEVLQAWEHFPTPSVVFFFEFTSQFFKDYEGYVNMAFKYNQVNKKCLGMHDIIRNLQGPHVSIPSSKIESQNILGLEV